MIGIISAMEPELRLLRDALCDRKTVCFSGFEYHSGKLDGVPCTVCECGIGKLSAACHSQILVDRFSPDAIVFTGVAGALSEKLNICDTVIASELVFHDFTELVMDGEGLHPVERVYSADGRLVSLASDVCDEIGAPYTVGRIATGDIFVSDGDTKKDIATRTKALCAEMEGSAVAHVATLAEVPFTVLRAISDKADGSADVDFPTFVEGAALRSAAVVREMIKRI